jgi:hypothetical protein
MIPLITISTHFDDKRWESKWSVTMGTFMGHIVPGVAFLISSFIGTWELFVQYFNCYFSGTKFIFEEKWNSSQKDAVKPSKVTITPHPFLLKLIHLKLTKIFLVC